MLTPFHCTAVSEGLKTSLAQLEAAVGQTNAPLFRAVGNMDDWALQGARPLWWHDAS